MSRQIAVVMCAINLDNQKKMLEGMIDAAKETDSNLFVFTNYISYKEKDENVKGAYQIMRLPDFEMFDGAIIAKDTIQYTPAANELIEEVTASGLATVSIDVEFQGMSCQGIASYEAELELVEHFILEHGCEDIYYVAGPKFSRESQRRRQAYCDALKKHGIEYKAERVYEGSFIIESGKDAVETFLAQGHCPQAIICANDDMAIGVIQALKKRGFRIPEDVKVAGFDNIELSELNNPALTTVNKNQHELGRQAVYEVLSLLDGKSSRSWYAPCEVTLRRSCGCASEDATDIMRLKDHYIHNQVMTQRMSDIMRNMMADFSGMERPEELIAALKKYVEQAELGTFYLCMCDEESLFIRSDGNAGDVFEMLQVNMNYTDEISIPLAYEDGEFKTYGKFKKGLVLPEECRNRSGGNCYVVTPLFYQRCCYGYCVCGNNWLPLEHSLYYSWIMDIGIGFENIRKWMMLKDAVMRLNGMWVYDMLTHLYNRAGFFYYARPMLEKMQLQDEEVFLVFMDIDGLKLVNDNLGHEAGDELIRGMAEVIKQNLGENQLAMRYGGDEFVIFGSGQSDAQLEQLVASLRSSMEQHNQRSNHAYDLRASIGVSQYLAREITNLDELIEQADKRMYEEKRRKRAAKEKENAFPC